MLWHVLHLKAVKKYSDPNLHNPFEKIDPNRSVSKKLVKKHSDPNIHSSFQKIDLNRSVLKIFKKKKIYPKRSVFKKLL